MRKILLALFVLSFVVSPAFRTAHASTYRWTPAKLAAAAPTIDDAINAYYAGSPYTPSEKFIQALLSQGAPPELIPQITFVKYRGVVWGYFFDGEYLQAVALKNNGQVIDFFTL